MRKFLASVTALAVAATLVTVPAFSAYVQTIFADGTNVWVWSSASNQAAFQVNGTTVFSVDSVAGIVLPISTVALLPTCATAIKGAQRMVSDATTPTYNGALTGGSTVITTVFCNGTAWLSH